MKPKHDSLVLVAKDFEKDGAPERRYYAGKGEGPFQAWTPGRPFPVSGTNGKAYVYVFPTRTYSEGLGSDKPADLAPEDRAMIRAARRQHGGELTCYKVSPDGAAAAGGEAPKKRARPLAFDSGYLTHMKRLFVESMTKPNRQDYTWLATKTFSFNLAVRLFFVVKAVRGGQLPMLRAVLSTSWYQLQDAVFTVFGQTYMKFLGKMTGMVRVFEAHVGDMVFVYFQLCGFEFLNRLVLG
ncbi:MAG: hypothetical protein KGL53_15915, partial [Elusimicrobia bacterium]|nr:hypothetical protein [Elusimicrobiota bacterium]